MRESAISESASPEQVAGYVVAEAVWAPSVNNTQPWWFLADGPQISLYADADRGLPAADPDGREMLISCGAALFNARLALRSPVTFPARACCRIRASRHWWLR